MRYQSYQAWTTVVSSETIPSKRGPMAMTREGRCPL